MNSARRGSKAVDSKAQELKFFPSNYNGNTLSVCFIDKRRICHYKTRQATGLPDDFRKLV